MQGRKLAAVSVCLVLLFVGFTAGFFFGTRSRGDVFTISAGGGSPDAVSAPLPSAEISPFAATVPAAEAPSSAQSALININTASSETLQRLPGIGAVLAGRIIAYRETNGPFKYIDEIMNVSGIAEKKFADIKLLICV